jgi:hypothetical protein
MSTFWSLFASGAGLLATLLFLLTFLVCGAFMAKPPQGANAMGLVIPLMASGLAAALLLVAGWTLTLTGRLVWLGPNAGWISTAVLAGVGGAAFGVLLTWASRHEAWIPPAGIFLGGIAPVLAGTLLWRLAWRDAELAATAPAAWLTLPLLLAGLAGAVLGCWGLLIGHRDSLAAREHAIADRAREQIERERRNALTPVERLREDYAQHSPETPLWVYTAPLPDPIGEEERAFVIARALRVPNFDADLTGNLCSGHPRYRHGALELLRHLGTERLKPTWTRAVADSIRASAGEIRARPDWLEPDDFAHPDPVGHVAAMRAVVRRYGDPPELGAALAEIRAALSTLPDSPARQRALAVLGPA